MDFELPREEIEALSGPMRNEQAGRLARYGQAILDASARSNLVSRRALAELGEHFVDSAALLKVVGGWHGELADLGSGAGFPGVVVAVLRPEFSVVLVEGRRRKVVFLKSVVRALELENVRVVHARIEDLRGSERFGTAVARAVGKVTDVIPRAVGVLEAGGRLVLFKGPRWEKERDAAIAVADVCGAELEGTKSVELPGLGRTTTFVVFHVKQGR